MRLPWRFAIKVAAIAAISTQAFSQAYPSKPVHIVTGPAGGGADATARRIGQGISGPLGQPVVIDNRSAILAAEAVAKAPPDGYTIAIAGSTLWTTPLLQKKMSYDAVADLAAISLAEQSVNIVGVHPSLPVKNIKELISLAKAKPGELNYSSSGTGGTSHLATALFAYMAGINLVRVPYKGDAPAITALIAGEVQIAIFDAGLMAVQAKSGRLRALAVTSPEPSPLAPGLPTVAASGLPGYESRGMTGIWAPAKTPKEIIARLNEEIARLLHKPEIKEQFLAAGTEAVGNSPEQFAAIMKADIARIQKLIEETGIKPD